jgi:hypothetical protein
MGLGKTLEIVALILGNPKTKTEEREAFEGPTRGKGPAPIVDSSATLVRPISRWLRFFFRG